MPKKKREPKPKLHRPLSEDLKDPPQRSGAKRSTDLAASWKKLEKDVAKQSSLHGEIYGLLFIILIIIIGGVVIYKLNFSKDLPFTPSIKNSGLPVEVSAPMPKKTKPTVRDEMGEDDIQKELDLDILRQEIEVYYDDQRDEEGEGGIYPASILALEPDYIEDLGRDIENINDIIYVSSKDGQAFELNIRLSPAGAELMAGDGGDDPDMLEVGNDLTLL